MNRRDPAESATVAWMLALLATLLAEGLGGALKVAAWQFDLSDRMRILAGTLLLSAALSGLIVLAMTPLVLRMRRTPPPRPIVVTAIVAGIVPLVTIVILVLR